MKRALSFTVILSVLFGSVAGGLVGFYAGSLRSPQDPVLGDSRPGPGAWDQETDAPDVVLAVRRVSPAVVSIIVSKDLPKIERVPSSPYGDDLFRRFFGDDFFFPQAPQYRQNGTERREIGGGSGFLISSDGYVVTNKHVVADEQAQYTVLLNDERRLDARIVATDPVNDLAVLKVEGSDFPIVELGDSETLEPGQTVIAIGNALGEFRNTVSVGVISGLSRSITAGGAEAREQLFGVIQTDASINPGNSGGPLLNLEGEVIGINTAIVQGAQNIGFAIPINDVKAGVESAKTTGKIARAWLGVRYVLLNEQIAKENNLSVSDGALIARGENRTDLAVIPGSPADKAGVLENDIILEVNGKRVTEDQPLAFHIAGLRPGDEATLKILRKGEEQTVRVTLEEMK